MAPAKIRLAVIDDHPLIREGIKELAQDWTDVDLVATGEDLDSITSIARTVRPDVMLVDYRLGGAVSAPALRAVTHLWPDLKVVAFTAYGDPAVVAEMIDAGAAGFLLKDADADDIYRAIRKAADGESPIDPRITASFVEYLSRRRGSAPAAATLDHEEIRLLGMLAVGMSNAQIGERLFVSEKTVKNRLTALYKKLGVAGRSQAAALAVERGYHLMVEEGA